MSEKKRPYRLPEPLLCDTGKAIDMDLINEYIKKHEERVPRYKYLDDLYKGFHAVFDLPDKESWKPDNRLAVNFPKYVTDIFMGFTYGIPVKKKHPEEAIDEAIRAFDKRNNIVDHDFELVKNVCKFGHAFEYFYQDEEAKTRVARNTPVEAFVVYENTLRKAAYFAVRYGYKEDGVTKYGEVMTKEYVQDFEGDKLLEVRQNPYGKIPIVEYVMNEERMSLYESIASLTELNNRALGEKANDVDSFAEAYLAILGAELDDDGVARIRDNRIINLYGTDSAKDILVQFLQKPTADSTQENLLERIERLIHKISMVPDINSESFGNASGVALEFKLNPMSNIAAFLDRKTLKSMSKRYKLFCTLSTNVPNKDAYEEIEFDTARNLPKNTLEESQEAANLDGIVSKETQLSVLSRIQNVKEEMDRIEKEEEEARKKQEQTIVDKMMFPQNKQAINNQTGQNPAEVAEGAK
jgi:SPP1 family phage portal protein